MCVYIYIVQRETLQLHYYLITLLWYKWNTVMSNPLLHIVQNCPVDQIGYFAG